MYNSGFYKFNARIRLKGNYFAAFLASLIYIIPVYLSSRIVTLLSATIQGSVIAVLINIAMTMLVVNIVNVGYFRFLLGITPIEADDEKKKYDYNTVLSGYTNNFKGTLKTVFIRELKLLGWAMLPALPLIIYAGIAIGVAFLSGDIAELYSKITQLIVSPTPDMVNYVAEFLATNYNGLTILMLIASVAMLVLMAPYIYKTYEYAVIDMVIADHPDMSTKSVFVRSKDIMHGFRVRYFMLQLSFLIYEIMLAVVLTTTSSDIVYYIAMAAVLPYINTTYLEFYRERSSVIEHNISVYGQYENNEDKERKE